jgi:hypothetical protein
MEADMTKKKLVDVAESIVLADGDEITPVDSAEIIDAVADLETAEAKREAYAEQPAETAAEGVMETPKAGKTKAAKEPKAPRAPRLTLATSKASDVIGAAVASMSAFPLTTDGVMLEGALLTAVDSLDKKTREKAVNLVSAVVTNKRPSVYTVQAVKALRESGGTLSLKGLVDYYLTTCSYKPGTARRQASEMFALFPAFRIASKAPGKGTPLVLNSESILLHYIEERAATPASA